MFIGPNLWSTVASGYGDNYEIIHKAKSNSLQICLVKTGETTPIISTLELRPLRSGIYNTQIGSLRLEDRRFYKSEYDTLRYVKSTIVIYRQPKHQKFIVTFILFQ